MKNYKCSKKYLSGKDWPKPIAALRMKKNIALKSPPPYQNDMTKNSPK